MIRPVALLFLLILPFTSAYAFDPFRDARIDQLDDASVPLDLSVRDETGRETTLKDLTQHKPILFVPVQHRCPNLCGITLSGLMQAIQEQTFKPSDDFTVVTFGIDPKEGPAEAEESLNDLHTAFPQIAMNDIHAVTAPDRTIKIAMERLGYHYAWDDRIGQYAHLAAIAILTPEGKLSRWIYGIAPDPAELHQAIIDSRSQSVAAWGKQILLLCYHYDPLQGKYGPLIWKILRIAALAMAALLLLALAQAHIRRRRNEGDES